MFYRILILLSFIFIFDSCKVQSLPSESITARQVGTYEMEIDLTVLASTDLEAKKICISKAFDNIFFIGTPNTINNFPLLEGSRSSHKGFFDSFIEKGNYAPFVTSISDNENIVVQKRPKTIKFSKTIRINIQSLRTYLTREGNIRRFGF
jgi:hypothetical protein